MTFLAVDSQKSLFTLQKNQLEFERTLVMNQANWITKKMGYLSQQYDKEDTNASLEDDPYYIQLQQQEEYLTTRQDALDTQINLLDNEISSMKQIVTNNIKSSCGLNLIGG